MSGTADLVLIETPATALRPLLPLDHDLVARHAALVAELAAHLTPRHAAILARPVARPTAWQWCARGTAMRRFADLSAEDRRALMAAGGAILSDVRRLAESGIAPAVAAAWPALREIPDPNCIFAVDGRPVLTAWGHAPTDGAASLFAVYDDGVTWRAPPRVPWNAYAAALACVAVLALAAGLLLPDTMSWAVPAPMACRVAPDQLDALVRQSQVRSLGEDLTRLLASVDDDIGRMQLLCPLPAAIPRPASTVPRQAPPSANRRNNQ
jgi:hypothetical protein